MRKLLFLLAFLATTQSAAAFCGFYVAKADGKLYNRASKVVFVRNGTISVITMSSDYRGEASDFAMVVPTPRVLERDEIRTVSEKTVAHLDSYTAPRLVEYFDHDPCAPLVEPVMVEEATSGIFGTRKTETIRQRARAQGVRIEAQYAVGRYDILMLSAAQSDGLTTFLTGEGYKMPEGAEKVLGGYIGMGMKFFVARVNLERQDQAESKELPPLQIRFRSKDFMLPIQLGKLNGDGVQDALFFDAKLRRPGGARELPAGGDPQRC